MAAIAKQYGTSAAVIAKINDLPGGRVSPGETLRIPQISVQLPDKVLLAAARVDRPETDSGRKQQQIVYRVRAGETLSSIARRHGMPVSTLARLNNMALGDQLGEGPAAGHQGKRAALSRRGRGERPARALHGAPGRHGL